MPGTLALTTLQPLAAAAALDAGYAYVPRPELCRRDGWAGLAGLQAPYRWMSGRLAAQDARPARGALPVWAWAELPPAGAGREGGTLITLRVDATRAFLTLFHPWNHLLHRSLAGARLSGADYASCLHTPEGSGPVQAVLWEIRPADVVSLRVQTERPPFPPEKRVRAAV